MMGAKSEPPRMSAVEGAASKGEIIVAHDPSAGDVKEVRNIVVQSSTAS